MAIGPTCSARSGGEVQKSLGFCCDCAGSEAKESYSVRRILFAIPAGLMLWAAILKILVGIAHRF